MRRLLHRDLGTIQPDLLHAFEGAAQVRHYRPGTTVYRRGRPVRGVFLIQKGRARLRLGEGGLGLHVAGAGSVLGLGETMSGCPYDATAETVEPCDIAFLRREDFLAYLRQNCTLCMQLVQLLSEDLHQLYQQYRTIGGPATRARKTQASGSSHSKTAGPRDPVA
ncbi:MAG TPA: cyclic nucleotide-binding domain-containing protein [Terriglobales bacterium]|nr:cyclic nucleotide-binding domain-containing protein [Terriglobales bacterium]